MKNILYILIAFLLTGCYMTECEDESASTKNAEMINNQYELLEELIIHGVTLDRNYKEVVGFYHVTPRPGIGGPEILSRDVLPAGTIVEVKSVESCTNWQFSSRKFVIDILTSRQYKHSSVVMDDSWGGDTIVSYASGHALINPNLFKELDARNSHNQSSEP